MCMQEEQAAKLKADNIRVALEKIKEAQVKKASREKMKIADKTHVVHFCMLFMCSALSRFCVHLYIARVQLTQYMGQVSVTPH